MCPAAFLLLRVVAAEKPLPAIIGVTCDVVKCPYIGLKDVVGVRKPGRAAPARILKDVRAGGRPAELGVGAAGLLRVYEVDIRDVEIAVFQPYGNQLSLHLLEVAAGEAGDEDIVRVVHVELSRVIAVEGADRGSRILRRRALQVM